MADRSKNIRAVSTLYGLPGETPPAAEILAEVVAKLGYDALTDEGLAALAAEHRRRDDAIGR